MSNTPQDAGTVGRKQRCVLLGHRAPGTPVVEFPRELLDKLAAKGFEVRKCDNRYMAMAELVLHEASRRAGWHRDPSLLVVVEPDQVPGVDELVDSVSRFVKKPVFWSYASGRSPRMQALAPGSGPGTSSVRPAAPATYPGAEPSSTVFGVPSILTAREPGASTFGAPAILTSREPGTPTVSGSGITTSRDPSLSRADVSVTRSRSGAASKLRLIGDPATEGGSPIRDLSPGGGGLLSDAEQTASGDDKSLLSDAEMSMLLSPEWKPGRTGDAPGA